jgi:hypothetical protein
MAPGDFRELLRLQPFQRFRLHLSNGAIHEVDHPELAIVKFSVVWLYPTAKELPTPTAEEKLVVVLSLIIFVDFIPLLS